MECILSQCFALGCYKAAPLALNLAPKARPYKSLGHTPQVQESIKRQSAEGATLYLLYWSIYAYLAISTLRQRQGVAFVLWIYMYDQIKSWSGITVAYLSKYLYSSLSVAVEIFTQ